MKTGPGGENTCFYQVLYTLAEDETIHTVELGFSSGRLLERLLQEPGQVIDRDTLVAYVWPDRVVGPGSLNQQVYTLRKLLGDEKNLQIIQTVPRHGYRLNPSFITEQNSLASRLQALSPLQEQACAQVPEQSPAAPANWRSQFLCITAIAVAGAGYFFSQPATELYASLQKVGANTVIYVDQKEPQVQELINATRTLRERMIELSNQPIELAIVGGANGSYQIFCSLRSGQHHVLNLNRNEIQNVSDAHLRTCVN